MVIWPRSHRLVEDLTRRENPRLDWTKWARGEPDSNGVALRGWPLQCAPMALSNIRTADEMKKILEAVIRSDLYFELVGIRGDKKDHANAWNGEFGPVTRKHWTLVYVAFSDHQSLRARRVDSAV